MQREHQARRESATEEERAPHVVIVGGGFGGLEAAKALAKAPVRVTVIDRTNHHVFQPLLYQVATAGLSPADIAAPIRSILKYQANASVIMAEVTGVDTANRRVLMGERPLAYDTLILATGARHGYFGHDEWERYAPGLKTLTDATLIRRDILLAFEAAEMEPDPERRRALLTFVLVGGGPTGAELAGAIAELARHALASDFRRIDPRQARILLLEAGPRILASFPEDLAASAQKALEDMGVEVRAGSAVEEVRENGVVVAGEFIPSATIIWAAGVFASPAGKWLGAETDRAGRVVVNPDLSVPGYPEIFVIGDTARVMQDGQLLPGVSPVAIQEGRYVGDLLHLRAQGRAADMPFRYHDKGNMATIGRKFAIVHIGNAKFSGFFAWLFWLAVHIFYLIGFRNRLQVMLQWAWAYFTFERGPRLITKEGRLDVSEVLPRLPA